MREKEGGGIGVFISAGFQHKENGSSPSFSNRQVFLIALTVSKDNSKPSVPKDLNNSPHIQNEALTQGKLSPPPPPPPSLRSLTSSFSSHTHPPTSTIANHPPNRPPIPHHISCSPSPRTHHPVRNSSQLRTPRMRPDPRLGSPRGAHTCHRRQLHGPSPHGQLPDFPR